MNNSSHSGDDQLPIQQDLVAYLDGELDDEGARRVEGLLSSDADAREEMHKLEGTWDLLEELPREEVGQSFTHTTVVQPRRSNSTRPRLSQWPPSEM